MIKIKLKQHLDLNTGKVRWTFKINEYNRSILTDLNLTDCMLDAIEHMHYHKVKPQPYRFKMNHYIMLFRTYEGKHRK